jgi:hypothetical protein
VTGVPTRYQSTTSTDPDYAGGNFLFAQIGTTGLSAGAHNWTVCTYADQSGAASTLPSFAGITSNTSDRLDHPAGQWFAPLEAGDVGVQKLTQMQCSASLTGTVWFMLGHPIAWLPAFILNIVCLTDGINTAFNLVRIFDDAFLTFLEPNRSSGSNCTYTGTITTVAG